MPSLLKKTSDKSAAALAPAWHPNFRNFQRLPDIKAVRTSFFTNGVAIVISLALAIYVIYRQYELNALRDQTRNWQTQITSNRAASEQAVALFKKFQDEEKQILALKDFLAVSKITVSNFLLQLGETLPPGITLTAFEYKPATILLRGQIIGSPDEASGQATVYIDTLRKVPAFAALFETIRLTDIVRDSAAGKMKVEVILRFKTPIVVKGAKK